MTERALTATELHHRTLLDFDLATLEREGGPRVKAKLQLLFETKVASFLNKTFDDPDAPRSHLLDASKFIAKIAGLEPQPNAAAGGGGGATFTVNLNLGQDQLKPATITITPDLLPTVPDWLEHVPFEPLVIYE